MIQSVSRYVSGDIVSHPDSTVGVFRNFPPNNPTRYALYTWKESDRIDRVAARFGVSPLEWWRVLDLNPMILDPNDIRPGQQIRVPRRD